MLELSAVTGSTAANSRTPPGPFLCTPELRRARGSRYGGRLTIVRGHGELDRELTVDGVSDQLLVFDQHAGEPAETLLKVG